MSTIDTYWFCYGCNVVSQSAGTEMRCPNCNKNMEDTGWIEYE